MDTLMTAADSVAHTANWTKTGVDSILAGDGITISIVGMLVVFTALALIAVVIDLTKRAFSHRVEEPSKDVSGSPQRNGISGELVAAIAVALGEHLFEVHDEERTILTISKVSKPYSPWSSKLYGMTPRPHNMITKS